MRADERRKVRKSRKRIRWNTVGLVRSENDADVRKSFAAVEWHYSNRLLR